MCRRLYLSRSLNIYLYIVLYSHTQQRLYLWEFCSRTTPAAEVFTEWKRGRTGRIAFQTGQRRVKVPPACFVKRPTICMNGLFSWWHSSILVTSARSEAFFQKATLPHLFTDTQLSVSVLNFNWTNGNAKLISLLCLQLSRSFKASFFFQTSE